MPGLKTSQPGKELGEENLGHQVKDSKLPYKGARTKMKASLLLGGPVANKGKPAPRRAGRRRGKVFPTGSRKLAADNFTIHLDFLGEVGSEGSARGQSTALYKGIDTRCKKCASWRSW